jgi:hypothetical protein
VSLCPSIACFLVCSSSVCTSPLPCPSKVLHCRSPAVVPRARFWGIGPSRPDPTVNSNRGAMPPPITSLLDASKLVTNHSELATCIWCKPIQIRIFCTSLPYSLCKFYFCPLFSTDVTYPPGSRIGGIRAHRSDLGRHGIAIGRTWGFRAEIAEVAEIKEISKMGACHQGGEVWLLFSQQASTFSNRAFIADPLSTRNH